jgi:ATP-binding cassette subfamily B protein
MPLVSCAATLCAIAGSYFASKVATGFGRLLRSAIFTRVGTSPFIGSASLVTRTTNDTTCGSAMLIMMLTMVITAPMMAIGGVILALAGHSACPGADPVMPVMALISAS